MCIPDAYVLGEGHPLQGVHLHSWGCAYQDTCVLGEGHPLQGVYLHSWGCAYQDAYVLGEGHPLQGVYLHSWGCAYQDTCVLGEGHPLQGVYSHDKKILPTSALNWTNFSPNRAHWLVGFPILRRRRCTGSCFIAGGVHTRTHVYWGWHPLQGVYLHNWGVASTSAASTTGGCTFIAGGVHTRMHVYWGWHPLQEVYLHNWGGGIHQCCINYRGVYLHSWGCAYQDTCVLGEGHPLQGVYSHDKNKSYQPVRSIGPISSPIEHTGW